ncbi:hypothetical protein AAFF_G00335520 [Aldrovandia affinis]|uniref:Uncharacterized protein n=1 Tax=Aldrovandia affinis TaxID=143900 RepID=A0AAD7SL92_9TELE|nr:hypothetical protein AAFF_G00335520 [Aldrovandia affinis]
MKVAPTSSGFLQWCPGRSLRNVGAITARSGSCYCCGTHIFSAAGTCLLTMVPDPRCRDAPLKPGSVKRRGTRYHVNNCTRKHSIIVSCA